MQILIKWGLFLIFTLFPLYFWAYALSLLGEKKTSVREKFWAGIIAGAFSVGGVFILTVGFPKISWFGFLGLFLVFLIGLYSVILGITQIGSQFSRGFIRKSAGLHLLGVGILFVFIFGISKYITGNLLVSSVLVTIFIPAFFEEITKHLSMLGLLGKNFSFSRKDLVIFTLCTVLGFVFIENILYFLHYNNAITTGLFRSIFLFSVHLLTALICTLCWWKALSYKFFSWKYLVWFLGGFLLATAIHSLYNMIILSSFRFLILFVYLLGAYGLFVFGIHKE